MTREDAGEKGSAHPGTQQALIYHWTSQPVLLSLSLLLHSLPPLPF